MVALAPYFCLWSTIKPQFLHKNDMLGSLDFTRSEHWAPQNFSCALYVITVEPLLWDTSTQGTPPFSRHKIWSWKNVHIIFVQSVSSIEGTPLFRGKGHFLKRWGAHLPFSHTHIYPSSNFPKCLWHFSWHKQTSFQSSQAVSSVSAIDL